MTATKPATGAYERKRVGGTAIRSGSAEQPASASPRPAKITRARKLYGQTAGLAFVPWSLTELARYAALLR